jgi:hypothetical protein
LLTFFTSPNGAFTLFFTFATVLTFAFDYCKAKAKDKEIVKTEGKDEIISEKVKTTTFVRGLQVRWSKKKLKSGTSETIRNNTENLKNISIHVPKHLKPLNEEQFGHYLAGLIDGDGHFSSIQQLVIVFNYSDVQLAYYIKKIIGFGHVKKVKNKNAYLYIISNKEGIFKTIKLINGKLRTINKFNQVIKNILTNKAYSKQNIEFKINDSNDFKNHWIAGFSDADASFQIKIVDRVNRSPLSEDCRSQGKPEIRLNFQIDQKNKSALLLIKEIFGGNIGYRKTQDTYYFGSTSFGSAKNVINYFDYFHLQSSKHINYLK